MNRVHFTAQPRYHDNGRPETGDALCGARLTLRRHGVWPITGYEGSVTCQRCQKLMQARLPKHNPKDPNFLAAKAKWLARHPELKDA